MKSEQNWGSNLIEPISLDDLERIQLGAELENIVPCMHSEMPEEIQNLAKNILRLCDEIKRLRYSYGEPWCIPIDKTIDEIAAERRLYERQAKRILDMDWID